MFTGLIEGFGTLAARSQNGNVMQLTIATPKFASQLHRGDSISVNGVCLTALAIETGPVQQFTADLAEETIDRTTLSRLPIGTRLNLEMPTPAGAPMGGHVVQGHVDGTGQLVTLEPVKGEVDGAPTDWRLIVRLPKPLLRYVVEKGSISIDGISLTVASVWDDCITIAILPHTYWITNLHTLVADAEVNIEVDALARYAEQMMATRDVPSVAELQPELTLAQLIAKGF